MSTVTKNAPVSAEAKLLALVQGRKAGLSMSKIAESIGMKSASFSVAISNLRTTARLKAAADPKFVNPFIAIDALPGAKSQKSVGVFNNTALMDALNAIDTPEVPAVETVETVETDTPAA